MFDPVLFASFAIAATLLAMTPGLDTVMVLRASITNGSAPALYAAVGILLGCIAWGAAVSLGLGAVLQASELMYMAIKLAGAGYLMWLGINLILKPRKALDSDQAEPAGTGMQAFWQGLVTNLLNPKIGIFYVSFLPQFIPAGADVAVYSFMLACVHTLISALWFGALIVLSKQLRKVLFKPTVVSMMDRVTGGLFIALGYKLAKS
ncbi:LysE family translocator [Oceanobacter kriegii]|uniref:LysE family translocator n=1 Tax=Oceanobacter kriegii TaxID=64972 RepID=UPI000417D548|nr:LysE family translocator [Oceanobacter kriegii]